MTQHQNRLPSLLRLPAAALLALGLFVAGCNDGDASGPEKKEEQTEAAPAAAEETAPADLQAIAGVPLGDMAEGSVDAPITLIEYASMTCSHCATFQQTTFPLLKRDFIDTGKVRFILREFPLDPYAIDASILARCTGEENFFPVVDKLFAEQGKWMPAPGPINEVSQNATRGRLADYGEAVGTSEEQFEACLRNKPLKEQIANRMEEAKSRYNVQATPSIVINGTLYEGSRAYGDLAKFLNDQLPKQ
jgi:protein-disulfide isomerase